MALPSAAHLLGLRRRLDGGADLSDAERELARLRTGFTEGALASGGPKELLQAFRDVWRVLSTTPVALGLYVPPLYANAGLNATLTAIVVHLVQRERGGYVDGSTTNIGHIVLGGVEGAGKSTLLRAVAIAAAVLLERMLPVTHVFDGHAPDYSVVRLLADAHAAIGVAAAHDADVYARDKAALEVADPYANEGLACAVAALQHEGHDVLLVLDEFQHVFALDGRVQLNCIAVAWHVRELSRMGATYGLLAGSSADMRALVFRHGTTTAPDRWRLAGFPDFNASLYKVRNVPALRTVAVLRAFLEVRYPDWHVNDADVAELLYWTGGIGRVVHDARMAMSTPVEEVVDGVEASVAELKESAPLGGTRRLLPSRVFDDKVARLAVTAIVTCHTEAVCVDAARDRHELACIGMPISELLAILRTALHVADAYAEMSRLADLDVLYLCGDEVQLARPYDAHVYLAARIPDRQHALLATVVHKMVSGDDPTAAVAAAAAAAAAVVAPAAAAAVGDRAAVDTGAGSVTDVDAGNELVGLVRRRVGRLMSPPVVTDGGWHMRVNDGRLDLLRPAAAAWAVATPALLAEANCQLLTWPGGNGLDGVVFERRPATAGGDSRPWLLHGWRCKGGRRKAEITGGALLEVSVGMYKACGTVTCLYDSTIGGIIVAAQVGMCKLMAAWSAAMDETVPVEAERPKVLPASLLITTTQDARLARRALEGMGPVVQLHKDVATTAGLPPALCRPYSKGGLSALTAGIEVRLHDGVRWLRDCVPDDVREAAGDYFPAFLIDDLPPPRFSAEVLPHAAGGCCVIV